MLRIEKASDGRVTSLRLSGRIRSDRIACIQSAMNDPDARTILDLRDVTLVDVDGIRFLIACEDKGVALQQCPPYVREWMARERAENVRQTV